jgi:hypothetical protein
MGYRGGFVIVFVFFLKRQWTQLLKHKVPVMTETGLRAGSGKTETFPPRAKSLKAPSTPLPAFARSVPTMPSRSESGGRFSALRRQALEAASISSMAVIQVGRHVKK